MAQLAQTSPDSYGGYGSTWLAACSPSQNSSTTAGCSGCYSAASAAPHTSVASITLLLAGLCSLMLHWIRTNWLFKDWHRTPSDQLLENSLYQLCSASAICRLCSLHACIPPHLQLLHQPGEHNNVLCLKTALPVWHQAPQRNTPHVQRVHSQQWLNFANATSLVELANYASCSWADRLQAKLTDHEWENVLIH